MRDHTKLRAFELADQIALLTYKLTQHFPREEIYSLTSQMRRAAISVPSNIVEGCARESQAEYRRFLEIAYGSLRELSYQHTVAKQLGFYKEASTTDFDALLEEAQKVLNGLIRSMR